MLTISFTTPASLGQRDNFFIIVDQRVSLLYLSDTVSQEKQIGQKVTSMCKHKHRGATNALTRHTRKTCLTSY